MKATKEYNGTYRIYGFKVMQCSRKARGSALGKNERCWLNQATANFFLLENATVLKICKLYWLGTLELYDFGGLHLPDAKFWWELFSFEAVTMVCNCKTVMQWPFLSARLPKSCYPFENNKYIDKQLHKWLF